MASESDEEEEELDAMFSSMEQPPLIKQLRQILSEYPDNGQIIKELLQNAEDARASEVDIIYDERLINQTFDKKKQYRKFFKGPALCVKNDSLFKEEDWRGIKMIASSVKEDDKMKVGRFGLGFKSVFHMTDYPCIMSGDRILLIDPTRPSDQVNAEMKLKDLKRYKGMDVEAFFRAFGDTLGITEESISQGHYPGTVFWFPLRVEVSTISSTLYDKEKITDLFTSFENDSSEILLFLCHLESVSLLIKSDESQISKVAGAEVTGERVTVRQKRKEFVKSIETAAYPAHNPIVCSYYLIVKTTNQNGLVGETKWIIVHYFMGSNSSEKLQTLVMSSGLGFNPLVGVAIPVTASSEEPFEGHVFCFMPLPTEESRLTGLPVHINGFFSLSQNRHHLKWATNDQIRRTVKDNNILWNQTLIDECIPEAYKELFTYLIRESNKLGNTKDVVEIVYRTLPEERKVKDKWKIIPEKLRTFLCQLPFLYSRSKQIYVTMNEALFATFTIILPLHMQDCDTDIKLALSQMNELYVSCSLETFHKLEYYNGGPLRDLTPYVLADILRLNIKTLVVLERSQKFAILAYILSGNQYNCLQSLPLLPVASGEWATYGSKTEVYLSSSEEVSDLFSEFKSKLMFETEECGAYGCWIHLQEMALQGLFQMRILDVISFKNILSKSIRNKLGLSYTIANQEQIIWLRKIWKLIDSSLFNISELHDVPLVPQLNSGNWDNVSDVLLHPPSCLFLKKNGIPEEVCEGFTMLGTTVLPDLPSWFPNKSISNYIYSQQRQSMETLLEELWSKPGRHSNVTKFNTELSSNKRETFLEFMSNFNVLGPSSLRLLKCLRLFREGSSQADANIYTSVNENKTYLKTTSKLPVKLPRSFIIARENSLEFLKSMGGSEINLLSLVEMVLKEMKDGRLYTLDECETFLLYFLDNIRRFETSHSLLNLAGEIPFLRTKSGCVRPKDLYDPDDDVLRHLFEDESNKFPTHLKSMDTGCKTALKQLGLKDIGQATAQDIIESANLVRLWSNDPSKYDLCVRKSRAVQKVLDNNYSLLQQLYCNTTMLNHLKQLKFISCTQERPKHFPSSLPWFSERFCRPCEARVKGYENECMVGATMPIVEHISERISSVFGWSANPPIQKVIQQLVLIKQNYRNKEKSNVLPLIKEIYEFLSNNLEVIDAVDLNRFEKDSLVWTGYSFESPGNVTITLTSSDLQDLIPYCHNIPPEVTMYECLFTKVGCHLGQSVSLLIQVIEKIKNEHILCQSREAFEKDRKLVSIIIVKLAERRNEFEDIDVLLPVQTVKPNQLIFHPASKCTVDKNASMFEQVEGDNSIVFVDDIISIEVAKALGAKSLDKQILSGTESVEIEGFGQSEKLTDRIRKLIGESYTDGLSVPKELVQNADDAGATVVKFLYDERQHEDARKLLLTKEMVACQGPSIVVYNNATFSDTDFINITKLNGATKEMDDNKIGRFGLGFCAVYNLTDVPSLISRSTVVIFDPQNTYLNSPGIKIDFKKKENEKLLKLHKDQFRPFQNLFDCDLGELTQKEFNGTLFRFPLRTRSRAQESEISKVSYNREEVHELFSMFVKNVGNMLLFTQHVQRLELHSIPRDAKSEKDQILLFTAEKNQINRIPASLNDQRTVLQRVSAALKVDEQFREIEQYKIVLQMTDDGISFFQTPKETQKRIESSWCVAWETGTKESLQMSKQVKGKRALPLSAVAVQCNPNFARPLAVLEHSFGFYQTGHMFCFLPLPIQTHLPVHINGSFDITSDRQRLLTLTADDKSSRKDRWNEFLLSDACVNAMFTLLQHFSKSYDGSYTYCRLWPSECLQYVSVFMDSFFRRIITENRKLFFGQGKFAAFSEVVFLDSKIRLNSEIGNHSFEMLANIDNNRGKILVDIPEQVAVSMGKCHDIGQAFIQETELFEVFLNNINHGYWNGRTKERNSLLAYALKLGNTYIEDKIKKSSCIPVEPHGTLKKPCELVDKNGQLASMYSTEEEVFVHADLQRQDILEELRKLGMLKNYLPFEALLNRFSTIEILAVQKCTICALKRSKFLLRYLNDYTVRNELKEHKDVIEKLSNMFTLPVLRQPNQWVFSWHTVNDKDTLNCNSSYCHNHSQEVQIDLTFARSVSLFNQSLHDICGTVVNVVDEDLLNENVKIRASVFEMLNVQSRLPTHLIVKHLSVLSDEYDQTDEQYKQLYGSFTRAYRILHERITTPNEEIRSETKAELVKLTLKPVILVGKQLFMAHKLAFSVEQECNPHLVKLPKFYASMYKDLFVTLGVRQAFTAADIIDVLKEKKIQWNDMKCDEIELIVKLLQNLEKCNDNETFKEKKDNIVAPDIQCRLYPMHELVLADDEFVTDVAMHILHKSVSQMIAERLGAKRKQMKCYEEIGIPFGPRESLVSRLGNLLNEYPCDSSIMKELLQNADDANASEINFIKDYRKHSNARIFADTCNSLQGPSLCVYNDSFFTEEDLQGIINLGEGSKRQDPTQTGQYGVGFNSVYHLTDTPYLMSKGPGLPKEGLLVIFDPTCKHLPNVKIDNPGIKCDVKQLQANFPGILEGFCGSKTLFKDNKGTLFRFPLRTVESDISLKCFSDETIDQMVQEMVSDMFEALLFVRNVERLSISNVTSGEIVEEYSVWTEVTEADKDKRKRFFNDITQVCQDVSDDKSKLLLVKLKEVKYQMRILDSKGRDETYFVVHRFGFDETTQITDEIIKGFRDKLIGCLPLGGVAHKISEYEPEANIDVMERTVEPCETGIKHAGSAVPTKVSLKVLATDIDPSKDKDDKLNRPTNHSKVFCFLPVPEITYLPVHVNGHFALDSARRGLIKDGFMQKWNECLLKNVVVPAYIQCIYHWKNTTSEKIVNSRNWYSVNDASRRYHTIFPLLKNIFNPYWKMLITCLYQRVISLAHSLFPVITQPRDKSNTAFQCEWVSLGFKGDAVNGHFNTFFSRELDEPEKSRMRTVESLLKYIGLKMIYSPDSIRQAIIKCELGTPACSSPAQVMTFISTSESKDGPCKIGRIGLHIHETKIKNVHTLKSLLNFLKGSKQFKTHLEHMPILLTNGNKLQIFSKQHSMFCSEFGWMFQDASDKFIHRDLVSCYPYAELLKEGFFKTFSVSSFIELIPYKFKQHLYSQQPIIAWNKNLDNLPTAKWIAWFWKFAHEMSENNLDCFNKIMDQFSGWAFLPVSRKRDTSLIQISKAFMVIDKFTFFGTENLMESVCKFEPFQLDDTVFMQGEYSCLEILNEDKAMNITGRVRNITTSVNEPDQLLEFLLFRTVSSGQNTSRFKIDEESSVSILKYFTSKLELKSFKEYPMVVEKLRKLPLFATLNESLVNINGSQKVFVVPPEIPVAGMGDLSRQLEIVLIKEDISLFVLYKFLNLSNLTVKNLYSEIVLPNINTLPRRHWLQHILFIRDKVLQISYNAKEEPLRKKMIRNLAMLDFIETINGYKTCSEFYDHDNYCFTRLCDQSEFLPSEFRGDEWKQFLIDLGMHSVITDELLIRFARRIERSKPQDESTGIKSNILIDIFTSNIHKWNDQTLHTLARIRFILPAILKPFYQTILPYDSDVRLVCMKESVEKYYVDICWSTLDVLPFTIERKYHSNLGMYTQPPVDDVLKHCQNVSTAIDDKHLKECKNTKNICFLMRELYAYIQRNAKYPQAKTMLEPLPIIHLPSEQKMVSVNDVVINISDVVKPYLFRAPVEYGQFFELFRLLGTSDEVKCYHYQNILQTIAITAGLEVLSITELTATKQAIQGLYSCSKKLSTSHLLKGELYFPNKHKKMFKSTELVIVNNEVVLERMAAAENINYFIGFSGLGLNEIDAEDFVTMLPDRLRPKLLTKIVKEQLNRIDLAVLQNSRVAMRITSYIQSEEFVRGICRIAKKKSRSEGRAFDTEREVALIKTRIFQIDINEVSKLETFLLYKDEIVNGSYRSGVFFFEQNTENDYGKNQFYFKTSGEDLSSGLISLTCRPGGLSASIVKHTGIPDGDVLMVVYMMRTLDNLGGISRILDEHDFPQLDGNIDFGNNTFSVFPLPGTYVEDKFLPFLEQSMDRFDESEYTSIAMELEDGDLDAETEDEKVATPLYIYVHIREIDQETKDLSPVKVKYIVDVGETELVEVPGYRLYRFVRRQITTGELTEYTGGTPQQYLPFDENCRRIRQLLQDTWTLHAKERRRIFRRLLFKWHPDKNRGSEENASRMFNFIKQCICTLERCGRLSDEDEDEVDGHPNDSSTYSSMYNNINRRAQSYARAYYDNVDEYNRSNRSGNYNHKHDSRSEVRNMSEAQRWMRQAKCDYQSATAFLPDAGDQKAYNWICYMSHQASEKALKAACYAKNANKVSLQDHSLTQPAGVVSTTLRDLAFEMERHVGHHTGMRYPDWMNRSSIPADVFTEDSAKVATEIARKIIEHASDHIA